MGRVVVVEEAVEVEAVVVAVVVHREVVDGELGAGAVDLGVVLGLEGEEAPALIAKESRRNRSKAIYVPFI